MVKQIYLYLFKTKKNSCYTKYDEQNWVHLTFPEVNTSLIKVEPTGIGKGILVSLQILPPVLLLITFSLQWLKLLVDNTLLLFIFQNVSEDN